MWWLLHGNGDNRKPVCVHFLQKTVNRKEVIHREKFGNVRYKPDPTAKTCNEMQEDS